MHGCGPTYPFAGLTPVGCSCVCVNVCLFVLDLLAYLDLRPVMMVIKGLGTCLLVSTLRASLGGGGGWGCCGRGRSRGGRESDRKRVTGCSALGSWDQPWGPTACNTFSKSMGGFSTIVNHRSVAFVLPPPPPPKGRRGGLSGGGGGGGGKSGFLPACAAISVRELLTTGFTQVAVSSWVIPYGARTQPPRAQHGGFCDGGFAIIVAKAPSGPSDNQLSELWMSVCAASPPGSGRL